MAIIPLTWEYVIFFDGTGNTAEIEHECTNVNKLHDLLKSKSTRMRCYKAGVGTRVGESISGNAWGAGIMDRIREAYRWLSDQLNYSDRLTDNYKIYIFGFSRGAYIARVFCWLLNTCGTPKNVNSCDELFDLFAAEKSKKISEWQERNEFDNPSIEMLGLWDTVKTADFPDIDFQDKKLAPNVKEAFHAMSLDELRNLFPILRFEKNPKVHEVWFAGIHSDVGGGYPAEESGLSNIALRWMVDFAIEKGLSFKNQEIKEDISCALHDEFNKSKWQTMCRFKDPIHPALPRTVESGDLVHESVGVKIDQYGYKPFASFSEKFDYVTC